MCILIEFEFEQLFLEIVVMIEEVSRYEGMVRTRWRCPPERRRSEKSEKNEKPAKELARTERRLNSHEQTPKQSGN